MTIKKAIKKPVAAKAIEPLKTPTAKTIIKSIENWIAENSTLAVNYSRWYVGVTNNEQSRKSKHKSDTGGDIYFWHSYNARSKKIALAIELHFHKKGMLETHLPGGTAIDTRLVYVYKKRPTLID